MIEQELTRPLIAHDPEIADVIGELATIIESSTRRVWVVGVTAAGKSTFAAELATLLGGPHVELDSLYWLPNWGVRDSDDFVARLAAKLDGPAWVVDGQYPIAVDAFLDRATCVVSLEPPLATTLWRLTRRTLRRLVTGAPICGDNRESVRSTFGPSSILLFAVRHHRSQRRSNAALLRRAKASGAVLIRSRWAKPAKLAVLVAERLAPAPARSRGTIEGA